MKIIKIKKIIKRDGSADYKGLDLKSIQSGTQVYPHGSDTAYFYYDGELVEHADVKIITETEYQQAVDTHNEYVDSIVTPEKEIEALKQSQADQDSFLLDLDFRQSMSEMGL